jgi:hypothetical protein
MNRSVLRPRLTMKYDGMIYFIWTDPCSNTDIDLFLFDVSFVCPVTTSITKERCIHCFLFNLFIISVSAQVDCKYSIGFENQCTIGWAVKLKMIATHKSSKMAYSTGQNTNSLHYCTNIPNTFSFSLIERIIYVQASSSIMFSTWNKNLILSTMFGSAILAPIVHGAETKLRGHGVIFMNTT